MALKVSRILHAGYVFECRSTQIAFDPIFENPFSHNCYAFPDVEFDLEAIKKLQFDAVFISHFHDDHCSLESLNFLDRRTPIYIYCLFDELIKMIKSLGFLSVHQILLDVPIHVGSFTVLPRRALDEDIDSIFHIQCEGFNVLNVVDSWIPPETMDQLLLCSSWDLVLWPFQTMRELEVIAPSRAPMTQPSLPEEWMEQLKTLCPRYLVPSSCQFILEHWSWYNRTFFPISYRMFQDEIARILPQAEVVRLNPSVSVVLENNSLSVGEPLSWVHPIGEQEVDYQFHPQKPPSTAEVSQNFPKLLHEETERVLRYCQIEILERFKSLERSVELYFNRPRDWRLSLYDHLGVVTHFYYRIEKSEMKRISAAEATVAWTTEVPIYKLYAALEQGESLTSMYVRINDERFEDNLEKQIKDVDIVEDPLIRCLFTGRVAAYQAGQLARLVMSSFIR